MANKKRTADARETKEKFDQKPFPIKLSGPTARTVRRIADLHKLSYSAILRMSIESGLPNVENAFSKLDQPASEPQKV